MARREDHDTKASEAHAPEPPSMFSSVTTEPENPLERDVTSGTGTKIGAGCGVILIVLMGGCAALIGIGALFPSGDRAATRSTSTPATAAPARPATSAAPAAKQDSYSGTSPTCGPISGKTEADLKNVMDFCARGIPRDTLVGAYAMESLLWLKLNEEMARAMMADRLQAEQLVKTWMNGWRIHSGQRVITVTVEWGSAEIAEGQTTVFSGDQVTMRR